MTVFSPAWFHRHQHRLVWWANQPVIGSALRDVLHIDTGAPLVRIAPSYIVEARPHGQYAATFRTHPKYGKRLHYGFEPLWRFLHGWDMLVANRWMPALNAGFDTLTQYPDAGNPGTTTVDGWQGRIQAGTWTSIVGGAGNFSNSTGTLEDFIVIKTGGTATWDRIYRAFAHFDTSGLGGSATISAATLSFFGNSKSDACAITPDIHVYASTVTSDNTLAANGGDYANVGSTAFTDTAVTYAGFSTSAYNDWTFNATGIAAISKTGVSKFAWRYPNDATDTEPTHPAVGGLTSDFVGYYADQTGTSNDPKLVVTYTVGGPASVTPGVAELTYRSYTPAAGSSASVTPATATVVYTNYAPSVSTASDQQVDPVTGQLTYVGLPPTIVLGVVTSPIATTSAVAEGIQVDINMTPGTARVTWTGLQSGVSVSSLVDLQVGTAQLVYIGYTPTVTAISTITVTPGTARLRYIGYRPTVLADPALTLEGWLLPLLARGTRVEALDAELLDAKTGQERTP